MKKTSRTGYVLFCVLSCIFILTLASCNKGSENPSPQQQSAEEQPSEKVPDQLDQIEASVENIFKALEGPTAAQEEKEGESPETGGGEKQQEGQESGQQQEGGQEDQSSQEGGKEQKEAQGKEPPKAQEGQPQPKDPWKEISPVMNTLHYQWNEYVPKAVKAGANKGLVENFSNALNTLTGTIIKKDKTATLVATNSLYLYIPDFYALYKEKTSPEIKRIRYFTRNTILNGMTTDWQKAESDMNNLKSSWSLYKNSLDEKQQEMSNKLDLSILEFEKVVKLKSLPLTDIKGRVALSNIGALEKSIKEEAAQTSTKPDGSEGKEDQQQKEQQKQPEQPGEEQKKEEQK